MASGESTRARRLMSVMALCAGVAPTVLAAQEAEVRAAVEATLAAWSAGEFEDFANFYRPDARGFFLDGGFLVETFDVAALRIGYESGLRAEFALRDLKVAIHGDAATSAAYLDGSLTLPGGARLPGTWRYTETRIRDEGVWKVVQYHFSSLTAEGRQ